MFGAIAAGADFVLFLLLRRAGLDLQVANLIGVHLGIAISFTCNAFFNFRRTNRLLRRALIFLGVGWTGLGLSALILHLGVVVWDLNETLVKAVSIVVVAGFQFTLNKLVTFRFIWGPPTPTQPETSSPAADSGAGSCDTAAKGPEPAPTNSSANGPDACEAASDRLPATKGAAS
ncbi:MAG: GtrA family protein [Bifidobacteriaceae bacterium]|nr:GtrA family protein [Bifidobacteriaceae bacterium]